MRDEPDIVKELRGVERLGALQSKVQSDYEELEVPEESPESISGKTVGFADDYVEGDKGTDTASGENIGVGSPKMENKYRLIAENTSDLICTTTFSLKPIYTYVSPSYKKILGYEPEEMIGKNSYDFIHPDDTKNITPILKKYLSMKINKLLTRAKQNPVEKFENRVIDKSGNWHYVENTANIIGKEILIVSKDVTERKKAEEELNKYHIHLEELVDERTSKLQQEIIERKQVEEVLQESEAKYRDLLENANDIIQSVTPDGHFVYVNRAWRDNFGYIEGEIADLSLFDIIHPDSQAHCMEMFQRVMSGEKVDNVEAMFVAKDGKEISVEGNVNCKFVDGKPVYTRCIFRDITESKTIKEKLERSEEKYRTTFEHTGSAMAILEEDTVISLANSQFEQLTGYPKEEIEGKSWTKFVHPDDVKVMLERHKVRRVNPEGVITEYEFRALRKDGDIRNAMIEVTMIPKTKKSVVSLIDITERKKADEALKESEGKYRALIEATDTGFVILDAKGNVLDANDEYVRLTGHKVRKDILGRCVVEWTAEYDKERNAKEVKKCFEQGVMRNLEIDYVDKAGKVTSIEINATAVKTKEGTIVITLCRDITERKQADEALQGVTEKLERKVDELQRYKKVTVGRELKMRELKKRIEDLEGSVKK